MDSRIRSQILYLWLLVLSGTVSTETPSPLYSVHGSRVQFDQAVERCLPGVLTTLATQQEVTAVLGLLSRSGLSGGESTFWIGLTKAKNQCVLPTLPLRGFTWLDHSQDSQVGRWAKEPEGCTTVRCVTLQVQLDRVNRSSVTHWGLVPVSCRETSLHPFICKLTDQHARPTAGSPPEPLEPASPESRPAQPENPESTPDEPAQPGSTPDEPARPETRPTDPQTLEPALDRTGPDSKWEAGPDPCQRPVIPRVRSFIPDPNNRSRIQVECWTSVHLLFCGGSPTTWRHEDGSPANYSVLCRPCGAGFLKDASGNCVDVDECAAAGAAPCRGICLNTPGSFRCLCLDPDGKHLDEGSAACALALAPGEGGVLVPVLAAVAALVLLAVVVMVTVMCCLRSRAKKRDLEEEEEEEEGVALKNTTNDRRST